MTPDTGLDAATLLACHDQVQPLPAERPRPLTELAQAEAIQREIVALRRGRGEQPCGFKIGFTNRSIWPLYGVYQPIWAPVYDTTVTQLAQPSASIAIGRFVDPRLEPEIVLGLARPPASAQPADIVAALDWYAHGFEIVQSLFPGWKFSAAEAFAAQGLHGALLVGPRRPMAELGDPVAELAALTLDLSCDGRAVARGSGANVLDSPVLALGHLVAELARRGLALRAGDLVTTGTLTDAQPLKPGQAWQTSLGATRLPGLTLRVLA